VPSATIGEEVMRQLYDLDKVAYVRFASVYRSFQDLDAFMQELKELIDERSSGEDRSLRPRARRRSR
jgi:transcriptional repressor NrdR